MQGQVAAFLIGFVPQTDPDQAYEHFFATAAWDSRSLNPISRSTACPFLWAMTGKVKTA
jgi:hypothetical protein